MFINTNIIDSKYINTDNNTINKKNNLRGEFFII